MLTFTVSGVAARGGHVALSLLAGAPTGATFLDNGDNSGTFRWTPTFDQGNPPPSHSYAVVFLGTDEQGLSGRAQTTISVNNVNRAPTANAGGPYSGTAGAAIAFSGTGSPDPDGDALTYAWDFGDSKSASGPTPSHIYATSGTYAVNLEVTDNGTPPLSDTATTSATIESQLPANVFQLTTGVIKLNKSKPSYCFEIEPEGDSYSNTDIIPASIVMKYGTGQISAEGDRNTVHSDVNRNGIDEARACFSRVSLQSLFLDLPSGDNVVTIAIEGDLTTGGRFRGVTDVTIRGPVGGSAMTASVSPNPFNPASVLTIFMPKAGFVAAKLYDLSGRLIRVLMEDPDAAAGYHDVRLDGQAGSGERLASGIYFYRVETREDVLTGRFAIMR